MMTVWQDIRYGVRMLRKNPGFTFVAVLTLALGIGANTTIFSLIDAVLLRPLPYKDSDRIVMVSEGPLGKPAAYGVSVPDFVDWREQSTVFEELSGVHTWWTAVLTGAGEACRFGGHVITQDYFKILGGKAVAGRLFSPEDYEKGGVLILSHGFWQRQFGGDLAVIGKPVQVSGSPYTIIGVLSPQFRPLHYSRVEAWAPLISSSTFGHENRSYRMLSVIGKLREGVTLGRAQAEMSTIAGRLAQEYPATNKGWGAEVNSLKELLVGKARTRLLVLFAAVCFVLLIACANVANLMLARSATREKEMAIRSSLGATRSRLVRLLLTESVLLGLLGGAFSLLVAFWGIKVLAALNPGGSPRLEEVALNARLFGITFFVALLTGVLFGLAPAWVAARLDLNETLKDARRQGATGRGGQRARRVLAVSEVALALTLLIGAGLMIRSFLGLERIPVGLDPKNVLTVGVNLPTGKYTMDATPEQKQAYQNLVSGAESGQLQQLTPAAGLFFEEARRRLGLLPGVEAASVSAYPPLNFMYTAQFTIDGEAPPPRGSDAPREAFHPVSPGYFRMLRIPLLKGRAFEERDTFGSPWVAVINETMARRYFADGNPIGRRLAITAEGVPAQPREIVGVVGDVRQYLKQQTSPEVYVPFVQQNVIYPGSFLERRIMATFVLRSLSDPAGVVAAARRVVTELDPDVPVGAGTLEQACSRQVRPTTNIMLLLGIFAGIAVALSLIGVYGVISYSVARRQHELGIRMALGASRASVLRLALQEGLVLALTGVLFGVAASVGLTRLIASLLYGVEPTDPLTFVCVSVFLAAVALLASYIPARRAARIDPMAALRYE
jgi:cell division protein FtsX